MGKLREFMDDDRPIMTAYYDVLEQDLELEEEILAMEKLIKQDPDFYDPYTILSECYLDIGLAKKSETILEEGYERAISRITDKKGNWPDYMEWGWLENRHIIRIIISKAINDYKKSRNDIALDTLRKLLKSCPRDNSGSRYYILAILMKIPYEKYITKFEKDGYMNPDIFHWFDKNSKRFPEEFKMLDYDT